jgi:membrane-bound ClpP family serine protease
MLFSLLSKRLGGGPFGSRTRNALSGADINVIMLLACFAGISLISEKSPEHLLPRDLGVAVIFLILVGLPIFPLSWVAVTGLSLYILALRAPIPSGCEER